MAVSWRFQSVCEEDLHKVLNDLVVDLLTPTNLISPKEMPWQTRMFDL